MPTNPLSTAAPGWRIYQQARALRAKRRQQLRNGVTVTPHESAQILQFPTKEVN